MVQSVAAHRGRALLPVVHDPNTSDGWSGALRLGTHHGAYCVGCCWALMLMQLVIGIMSVPLMLATAIVIGVEKTWRHGERAAVVVGSGAIAAGLVTLVRAL